MYRTRMNKYFAKKKRRVVGESLQEAELKRANGWVRIHASSKTQLLTYESQGFVTAINGSGSLDIAHSQCKEARQLAEYVAQQGGIVLTGGRNGGIMESASMGAQEKSVGIIFPELKPASTHRSLLSIVNAPPARTELLATCSPFIFVFRGGVGTLMILMRAVVHLHNRRYHPEQPPQALFVSQYWIPLLSSMKSMGCLPAEFLKEIQFFDTAASATKILSSFITKA